jgi:hypothetical protein
MSKLRAKPGSGRGFRFAALALAAWFSLAAMAAAQPPPDATLDSAPLYEQEPFDLLELKAGGSISRVAHRRRNRAPSTS